MHWPIYNRHTVDGGEDLLIISDVGPKSMGYSPGMFDFEFGDVEFALAPAKKADSDTGLGETNCEALSDSTPGASDQRGHILRRGQRCILPPGPNEHDIPAHDGVAAQKSGAQTVTVSPAICNWSRSFAVFAVPGAG
jgi:hypothetical protein